MKRFINNIINWRTLMGTLILIGSLIVQSCKDEEQMKWVDLRYLAEDSYTVAASNPDPITIQVKSTDPWEVFSQNPDWCSIEPAKGEAGKIFDVKITYTNNTSLDDRTDVITVKSDYWIGKEIAITQKGTAYLRIEEGTTVMIEKSETTQSMTIKSNQDWSAAIIEGTEWLSIQSGENGKLDGTIMLKAKENKGEQRVGKVVIYDRHGEEAATVTCTQKGIVLLPETQSIRAFYNTETVTLHVESNGEWTVTKENEEADWYSFNQTEFNGNADIVITLHKNEGTSVRKAKFNISSKAEAGSEAIVKTVTLKQGNLIAPERHEFLDTEWTVTAGKPVFANGSVTLSYEGANCRISRTSMKPGNYRFHISSSELKAKCQLYFLYGDKEVRWMLFKGDGSNARCGTSDGGVIQYSFADTNSEYTMGMNIQEGKTPGNMSLEWLLDGKQMRLVDDYGGVSYGTEAQVILGVTLSEGNSGSATFDWWEYTAPIEWGDE